MQVITVALDGFLFSSKVLKMKFRSYKVWQKTSATVFARRSRFLLGCSALASFHEPSCPITADGVLQRLSALGLPD